MTMLVEEHCQWSKLNAVAIMFTNLVAVNSGKTTMGREQLVVQCFSTSLNSKWVIDCKDVCRHLND